MNTTPFQEYIDSLVAQSIRASQPHAVTLTAEQLDIIGHGIAYGLTAKQLQSIGQEIGIAIADRILQSAVGHTHEGRRTEKDVEQIVSRVLDAAEKKRARQVFLDDYS